jgi:prevent-host-death family protein
MVKSVTSAEAKAGFDAILAEVRQTGISVVITHHGLPVAMLCPPRPRFRTFGQLPDLSVGDTFNDPLPKFEITITQDDS